MARVDARPRKGGHRHERPARLLAYWNREKGLLARHSRAATSAALASGHGDRPCAKRALVAVVLAAAALTATSPSGAATYKWVDEKGVVHYSDKIPPDAVDKASVELNTQGIPIKKTDRALTPEQRRANELEADRQRQADRAREDIARRDRALVSSYTSEAEIDLARNRSLQTINAAVQSAQAFSEQLTKRKADVEVRKAESQGKSGVAVLDRELDSIEAELARQAEVIAQKKRETAAITAKYDADKQRWRELVAAKVASDTAKPAGAAGHDAGAGPASKK